MNLNRAIPALLHLFACFTFLGSAIFFLSLPFLLNVRIQLCSILLGSTDVLTRVGYVCLAASFILFLSFYFFYRGRSLRVGMKITVDAPVILKTLGPFFKEHFGGTYEVTDLHLSPKGKLEIEVLTKSEDPDLLASLEGGIASLLKERFGYSKPFFLNLKKY